MAEAKVGSSKGGSRMAGQRELPGRSHAADAAATSTTKASVQSEPTDQRVRNATSPGMLKRCAVQKLLLPVPTMAFANAVGSPVA